MSDPNDSNPSFPNGLFLLQGEIFSQKTDKEMMRNVGSSMINPKRGVFFSPATFVGVPLAFKAKSNIRTWRVF